MKSIDIFIKSYHKDFSLLKYSLMSLKKNVTGYDNLIIVIPREDDELLVKMLSENEHPRCDIWTVDEYGSGYLYQQLCKMNAHIYSNADFIMFSDSDIIFDHPVNLQDFIEDGKPEILYTDYNKVDGAIIWKEPTEKFIGEDVLWEGMRRNNLIYHRSTLEKIEEQYPELESHIMTSERFSEFNAMFAWAFKHEQDKYSFVNTDTWKYTPPVGTQLWSWGEKDNQDEPHLYEYARSLKVINETLGINIIEI